LMEPVYERVSPCTKDLFRYIECKLPAQTYTSNFRYIFMSRYFRTVLEFLNNLWGLGTEEE
jgi:hypothetical protein